MKKIMFNDKYCLTKAVLEGKKTMTRRIIKPQPTYCGDKGLLWKGNYHGIGFDNPTDAYKNFVSNSPIKIGEVVAIAQSYCKLYAEMIEDWSKHNYHIPREDSADMFRQKFENHKGWNNKMFVRADVMPHRLRITDIKVERLQEISREDCLLEGIYHDVADGFGLWWWDMEDMKLQNEFLRHEWNGKEGLWFWDTPQGAFAALTDKVYGKGTWDKNPFVFAYEFDVIDLMIE